MAGGARNSVLLVARMGCRGAHIEIGGSVEYERNFRDLTSSSRSSRPGSGGGNHQLESGFLEALFDFSFRRSVTGRIVKLAYGLSVAGAGLFALLVVVLGFRTSSGVGILSLLFVAPFFFFGITISVRFVLEGIMVLHNIETYTRLAESHLRPALEELQRSGRDRETERAQFRQALDELAAERRNRSEGAESE